MLESNAVAPDSSQDIFISAIRSLYVKNAECGICNLLTNTENLFFAHISRLVSDKADLAGIVIQKKYRCIWNIVSLIHSQKKKKKTPYLAKFHTVADKLNLKYTDK